MSCLASLMLYLRNSLLLLSFRFFSSILTQYAEVQTATTLRPASSSKNSSTLSPLADTCTLVNVVYRSDYMLLSFFRGKRVVSQEAINRYPTEHHPHKNQDRIEFVHAHHQPVVLCYLIYVYSVYVTNGTINKKINTAAILSA